MKNVLLLVPDGTGIKNYLYSKTFQDIDATLHLAHNFDVATLSEIKKRVTISSEILMPQYQEGIKEKYYRELIHKCRINHNEVLFKNPSIQKFYKPKKTSAKGKLFYNTIETVAKTKKNYTQILSLEQSYQKQIRRNPFYASIKKELERLQPEVVFCTHQRALSAPCFFAAAQDLNIKTITVIYSWDNVPKARLALKADRYLVWSTWMKKELLLAYPEIEDNQVAITGSPQFEFYKDPVNIIEKDTFYDTYGLDKDKGIICFSGDDVRTSPHDPQYLQDVAAQVKASGLDKDYQIVFRRCPVDVSGRYQEVIAQFKDLIIDMPPLWNIDGNVWSAIYPRYEDVKVLVSLAKYSDIVINVGSTMAFDFGMFNKPCIFINYDQEPNQAWTTKTIYEYQHFRSMPTKDAVYWFNSKSEILNTLKLALSTPETAIEKWFNVVLENTATASTEIRKIIN